MPHRIQKRKWNGRMSRKRYTHPFRKLARAGLALSGYNKYTKSKRSFRRKYHRSRGRRGRRATESSTITGSSKIAPVDQRIVCRVWSGTDWIYFWSDTGDELTTGADEAKLMTHKEVNAKPVLAWNMVQRQSMYKKFRITGVDYHLFSDSVAKQAGNGLAMASFVDPCDKTHSLLIRNSMRQAVPDPPLLIGTSDEQKRKFLTWLSNQSGTKKMRFGGAAPLNMKWKMKPKVNVEEELFPMDVGIGMISTKTQKNFPWMDFERDLNKDWALGHCDLFFPILEIMPIIPNLDLTNATTRKLLVMSYHPQLQTTIHWQCSGKWIDADYVDAYFNRLNTGNHDHSGVNEGLMPRVPLEDDEPTGLIARMKTEYQGDEEVMDLSEKLNICN